MNFRLILKNLGIVMMIGAAAMLPSLIVSVIYAQNDMIAFLITIFLMVALGYCMFRIPVRNKNIYTRDGFAIASMAWILISFFGALPFFLSGCIPSFVDAFFESVSGFTTTGSSILREVESLPKGILFWRSFTNWIGGMGVLVMMLAVLPAAGASTVQIMKAESPGPDPGKLVPKIGQSAKILYIMYTVLTAFLIIFLLIGGMPLYDTLIHAFSTAGTGGFSNRNLSVGAFDNVYFEIVIAVFMLIFGVNFSLYYHAIKGDIKNLFKDEELRFYLFTIIGSILFMTWNIYGSVFDNIWVSLRHSFFQTSSVITTTGFSSTDFDLWPAFSKTILVMLMFMGASAGSTAGGIKCIRFVLLFKTIKQEIGKIIHPRSVYTVKYGGKTVDSGILSGIMSYFFVYAVVFSGALLIISLDRFDPVTNFTAVTAAMNNIGPGFGIVGPMGSFADFSDISKIVLSFSMLFGRLEIYPMLVLFTPMFWKRVNI